MFESPGHCGEAAPMREAVGGDGDKRASQDAEEAERRPDADQGEGAAPFGQPVDHPSEQDRLGQLNDRDQHARHGKQDRQSALGRQKPDRAAIDCGCRHGTSSGT